MRQWSHRDQQLADEITAAEQAVGVVHGELARLAGDTDLAARDCARREETLRRSEQNLNSLRATLDQAQAALGTQFPDEDWWRDRSRRDLEARPGGLDDFRVVRPGVLPPATGSAGLVVDR